MRAIVALLKREVSSNDLPNFSASLKFALYYAVRTRKHQTPKEESAMKKIRDIVRTVMNCLEFGGFDDVQAKIAEHLGAPVDGYTIVIVAGDYERELMLDEEADGIDSHEWIESIQSCGWEPDAERIQQARQEAQKAALVYGGEFDRIPACFCATIEDRGDYYLIVGLEVIGPDAEAGRLELEGDQVKAYLNPVFEGLKGGEDEDDEYEDDDGFRGAVEVFEYSGDPIPAGDSEGEEEDFEET